MVLRIALCCSVLSAVSMGTSRGITNSLDFYHVLFILFIVAGFIIGFIYKYQLRRAVPRPNCNERGDTMKAHKKGMLGEKDRVQEAKFWVMMRKAGPGKQCLK